MDTSVCKPGIGASDVLSTATVTILSPLADTTRAGDRPGPGRGPFRGGGAVFGGNVGVDLGYGFLKATDGGRDWILPSVVGVGQELAYQSDLSLYTGDEDNLAVELDGERFFVGSLAGRQSEIAARSLAEDRPGDRDTRVLFCVALGLLTDGPNRAFNVVTGLPPAYYRSSHDALTRLVRGEHRIA